MLTDNYEQYLKLDGRQLKTLRKMLNLTAEELGKIVHVTRQTIFNLESDLVRESTRLLVAITLIDMSANNPTAAALADIYLGKNPDNEESVLKLANAVCEQGLAMSFAEVRRLVDAQAIVVNGELASSLDDPVRNGDVIACGKHKEVTVGENGASRKKRDGEHECLLTERS